MTLEERPTWENKIIEAIEDELLSHGPCDAGCTASSETMLEPIRKAVAEVAAEAEKRGYERGEKETEEAFADMAEENAHQTEQGYCCACPADSAFFNEDAHDAVIEERKRIEEAVKKLRFIQNPPEKELVYIMDVLAAIRPPK